MVYVKPRIRPEEWDAPNSLGFWDTYLISARLSELVIVKKKKKKKKRTSWIADFAVPADHRVKMKENETKDKNQELSRELKTMEYEGYSDTKCSWCTWDNAPKIGNGTGRRRNERTRKDHPDYRIIKIGENTEKSPGDLRRLAVTQAQGRNHQLTLVRKTLKWVKNNNS